ncbi:MAG TPA: FecR domain-containing protein [Sphingomicrobium sp.]|jgi:transmembrane sensor|nr:FecR domain-containing protein [Sphingomicrobium sp.]
MTDAQEIEANAAQWLIRQDATGDTEAPAFAAWLAADSRHRAAYIRLAAAWQRTARLKRLRPEGDPVDSDLLSPTADHKLKRGLKSWTPFSLAAGIAILALSVTLWFTSDRGARTYRTDVGGLSRVVLADGSTVTLNTDTELRVRMLPERREIDLLRGEAQFAVAHDASRPFEVSAARRIVRAVGTAFDVRLDPDRAMQVLVTEGRVAVEDASGIASVDAPPVATVSAGESAVAHEGRVSVHRVSSAEQSRRLAWQVGELSFQGEALREAVAEFNRYNRRKLKVEDRAIADREIGGVFQATDVDSFVAALQRSFDVTASASDDGTIVLKRSGGSGTKFTEP